VISTIRKGKEEHAQYFNNVVDLVKSLKQQTGKDIYCDCGADIIYELLSNKLFDHIIVSVIPHLLGDGIRLFKDGNIEQQLKFKRSISFPSGLVQLWYDIKNDNCLSPRLVGHIF
jgi:dihydrofolate reductase